MPGSKRVAPGMSRVFVAVFLYAAAPGCLTTLSAEPIGSLRPPTTGPCHVDVFYPGDIPPAPARAVARLTASGFESAGELLEDMKVRACELGGNALAALQFPTKASFFAPLEQDFVLVQPEYVVTATVLLVEHPASPRDRSEAPSTPCADPAAIPVLNEPSLLDGEAVALVESLAQRETAAALKELKARACAAGADAIAYLKIRPFWREAWAESVHDFEYGFLVLDDKGDLMHLTATALKLSPERLRILQPPATAQNEG